MSYQIYYEGEAHIKINGTHFLRMYLSENEFENKTYAQVNICVAELITK